jgi:hypothetical protein
MIFTSLGLLLAALALFIAGIVKSSVALLVVSLVVSAAAGAILFASFGAARKLAGAGVLGTGGAGFAPGGMVPSGIVPGAQPVVMYVAPDQLGIVGNGGGHTGGAVAGAAPPIVGYDEMSAQQVAGLIASGALTEQQLAALRVYETGTAARKTVLDKLDKALAATR